MVCIDDEIPFEIPSGWEWCRLGSLVDFSKSKSVKANNIAPDAWLLDLEDIEKDSGKLLHKKRKGTTTSISDKHRFERGNVLYSKLRPYLNKVIIADEDGYCTSEILCFDFGMIYNKYAQLFLMSPFFVEYAMSDAYGVKMPRLGSKQGNNGLIPIPPREEQTRIVNFINSLEPYIEKYSNAQASLDIINKEVKNTLKKSILQEAIQGKLVTQDNSEESASILLQRIKEEKLRLVKEGKLKKKDVIDSTIFRGDDNKYYEQIGNTLTDISEEIPFSIPDSWVWSRLSGVVNIIMGQSPDGNDVFEAGKMENAYEFHQGKISFTYKYIAPSGKWCKEPSRIADIGSLLVCVRAPIGDVNITQRQIGIGRGLAAINGYNGITPDFLFYWLLAHKKLLVDKGTGSTFKAITVEVLKDLIIPIPPLAEQQRIVSQIKTLYDRI